MRITAVNFSDKSFEKQRRYSTWSLKNIGRVNNVISYSPDDINEYIELYPEFKKYHYKGFGNYFWKAYIIKKSLESLDEGDFLIYMDSGTFILKNLSPLCKYLDEIKKDILVFESPLIEKQWTKMDAFALLDATDRKYLDQTQLLSGYIVIKNSIKSRSFVENFRIMSTDERIISDLENTLGLHNDISFKEHRHDQSILSILARKNEIVHIERDLSDYGVFPESYLRNNDRLFDKGALNPNNYKFKGYLVSNRKAHPILYTLKYFIKRIIKSL